MPLTTSSSYTDRWGNVHANAWLYIDFFALRQGERLAGLEVKIYSSKADADAGKPPIDEQRIDLVEGGIPPQLGPPELITPGSPAVYSDDPPELITPEVLPVYGDQPIIKPGVPSFVTMLMQCWDEYSALDAKLCDVVQDVVPGFSSSIYEPPSIS